MHKRSGKEMNSKAKNAFHKFLRRTNFMDFELGASYLMQSNYKKPIVVKFIKVTRKGYNFLDECTNKCVLKRHVYSRTWAGKEIPEDLIKITRCRVPDTTHFEKINKTVGDWNV
jgi:hypothetical protein